MAGSLAERYVDASFRATKVAGLVAFVALLAAPTFVGKFDLRLLTSVLILVLFAVSYDLLIGYAGVLSFGHALPYGVAAYMMGLALSEGQPLPFLPEAPLTLLPAVGLGLLAVVVVMFVTGALALRTSGVYFAMVTLAFAQIGYVLFLEMDDVTRGANGLFIEFPPLFGFSLTTVNNVYYLTLLTVVGSYLMLRHIVNSPYGLVLMSMRENDERAQFLGFSPFWFKLTAYVISGIFAGIAGMLFAIANTFITPNMLYWTTTGDIVIMAIIGGIGTLWGPAIGVAVTFGLEEFLSGEFVSLWPILLGAFFIGVVLLAPEGLAGLVTDRGYSVRRLFEKLRR